MPEIYSSVEQSKTISDIILAIQLDGGAVYMEPGMPGKRNEFLSAFRSKDFIPLAGIRN